MKNVKIFPVLLALVSVGCASIPQFVGCEQNLIVGQTTVEDAKRICGKPQAATVNSDGLTVMVFTKTNVSVKPATLIPVVGGFVGGADASTITLSLVFKNGVLKSHSNSTSDVSVGGLQ